MLAGAKFDRTRGLLRHVLGHHDKRRGAVRDQRTVGQAQRRGHHRVLVADGVAEIETHILLHLRQRVVDRIGVVLGGDTGEGFRLVAVFLEIGIGKTRECLGKGNAGFLGLIGGSHQRLGHALGVERRHLFGTDHQHDTRLAGLNGGAGRIDGGRTGCAGVFHPCRGLEAQPLVEIQHQRRRETILDHAAVEMSDKDRIHLARGNSRMFQRLGSRVLNQVFQGLAFKAAEFGMAPADDARIHDLYSCR